MSYFTFSDSDDNDVIPLSQRIGSMKPPCTKAIDNGVTPSAEVVDIAENSSSPIPIPSSSIPSPSIPSPSIPSPSSPIPSPLPPDRLSPSSPLPEPIDAVASPAPTPRPSKKKKQNTPRVVPGSCRKNRKKSGGAGDERVERKPKRRVETGRESCVTSSQSLGSRPAGKISCRDCEARIDHSLIESHFSDEELRKAFAEFEVRFRYNTESVKPKTVTWVREVKVPIEHSDCDDSPTQRVELKEESHVMILLDATDFAQMVHVYKLTNSLQDDVEVLSLNSSESSVEEVGSTDNESPIKHSTSPSFISYCKRMCITYLGKDVTILLVGLTVYFQRLKSRENKKYRDIIHGKDPSRRKSSMRHPRITREDVMEVLVNLDLNLDDISSSGQKVRVLFAEKPEDVVTMIASFTKTIAEAPFKKSESKSLPWFADGDKSSSVDVKSVDDVPRLWRKQLEQFPKVSQQVAESIASIYKTPLDLLDVYGNIYDRNEAESLLEDIPVGKGNRRVGPEASRRICTFMTATNGDLFINTS